MKTFLAAIQTVLDSISRKGGNHTARLHNGTLRKKFISHAVLFFIFWNAATVSTALAQCVAPTSTIVNNGNCTTPTGKITFTAPTPTSDYLFSIDGGNTYGTAGQTVFSGLFGGDYPTLAKKISTGCISTSSVKTLTNPASPAVPTSTVTNNSNCLNPNGKITFTAPTPLSSYAFSIDNGNTFGSAGQTAFTNLAGGSYPTVVKSTITNCVSTFLLKTVANPTVTAPTSTVGNVTNCNTPNGSITFTGPTPTSSYQFSIDGGVSFGATGQVSFTGLTPGTKSTVAKLVATGCVSAPVAKTIAKPAVTAPTSTVTAVSNCNTPNGKITFTAPTPVASYSFSTDGGATFGTAGQTVFANKAAGTYSTVVKLNSSGCTSASVAKVIANPAVTKPTGTATNVTNCNAPNGKIVFTAPTPLTSYAFSVDGGVTFGTTGQTTFTGLSAGTKVTIAKLAATGCRSAATNIAVTNPVITVPTSTVTASSCNTNTGTIVFSAPTPLASYMFTVSNNTAYGTAGQTTFSGLAPGTYITRAKVAATGCISALVSKTIVDSVVAAPTSTLINPNNCNTPNGSITFTSPTPTSAYQFSIDGGNTFGAAGQVSFTGLDADVYATVAKKVSSSCISASAAKTLTNPTVIAPTVTPTAVTTCATPNGKITITAPTPLANYQFSVDGGVTFGAAGQVSFTGLQHGSYQVVSKLVSSGCKSNPVTTTVSAPTIAGADQTLCQNQTATMAANVASGASWIAMPGNPSATTITTPTSNVTTITGFDTTGVYSFIWQSSSCADTMSITVSDCLSPLACTNLGYLFQSTAGTGTDFITVNLQTGAATTVYNEITTNPEAINAIGYNITDGHIWGSYIGAGNGKIVRVGGDGNPVVFTIPGLPSYYNVGAVSDAGVLFLYASNTTDIYRVDVNPASPTYLTLLSPTLNTTAMGIADWAYNSVDGNLYGVNANPAAPKHQLLKINTTTGVSTIVGTVTCPTSAAFDTAGFGAAYLDAFGNLYVSDNLAGGIYKIKTVQNIAGNSVAQLFSNGSPSAGNDGAFCSFACLKPDAGRDTMTCITGQVSMSADSVSGINWIADGGNPGTAVIVDSSNANTVISNFSATGVYNFIWVSGGLCGDTATVTVYDCVMDTVTARPPSATCSVLICGTPGSITPTDSTVYSTCGLSSHDATQGTMAQDNTNGCITWTPTGQTDTVHTCIVTCNGPVCDTTYVVILPPGTITDTIITVMPSCPTCPVTGICPIVDDIPVDGTTTYSTCGLNASESSQGSFAIDPTSGCGTWTPNGTQTDSITTCIVACTVACDTTVVCDTTFVIIPPYVVQNPLGVELVSFTGTAKNCTAVIDWETANERNIRAFILERSNGTKWTSLATIVAAGNTTTTQNYGYTDEHMLAGKNLYRLKTVDISGSYKYSNMIVVNNNCTTATISVFPNPGNAGDAVNITSNSPDEINYEITNVNGRAIASGSFTNQIQIKGLPSGIYLLHAGNATMNTVQKIMIQ